MLLMKKSYQPVIIIALNKTRVLVENKAKAALNKRAKMLQKAFTKR